MTEILILRRAWQSARSAYALSNQTPVSDLCHGAMQDIETALLILEGVK